LIVAAALRVRHFDLYPEINWSRPMDETIHQNLHDEIHGLNSDSEPNQIEHLWKPTTKLNP
jgi:hypothetical protein